MAEVIDYPANKVKPGALPARGDQYEAYGLAKGFKPLTINFVLPDWSMVGLPYAQSHRSRFQPLGNDGDCDGECVITLTFGGKLSRLGTVATITGANLYHFLWHFGNQQIHWAWARPEQFATVAEGTPVIRSIDIKDADGSTLDAMDA